MKRSSRRSEILCTSATPKNAAETAPAIIASATGNSPSTGARERVPPLMSRALTTVTRLMARLSATARRAA